MCYIQCSWFPCHIKHWDIYVRNPPNISISIISSHKHQSSDNKQGKTESLSFQVISQYKHIFFACSSKLELIDSRVLIPIPPLLVSWPVKSWHNEELSKRPVCSSKYCTATQVAYEIFLHCLIVVMLGQSEENHSRSLITGRKIEIQDCQL